MVGPAHGVHAGSLICTGCGRHRGWIAATALEAMRDDITKIFGRPVELPVLRTPPKPEEKIMNEKTFDNTNRGALFKNLKKRGENDPDYTGNINFDGRELWLSAWLKTSKTGVKFMSLSVRSKDASAKVDPISTGRPRSSDAMSDDIPFNMEWRG
jgi:hypothetical protein